MTKKKKQKKSCWDDVGTPIKQLQKNQLLDLIHDFYRLSHENKDFLHTRFSKKEDPLPRYKKIIQDAMDPYIEENEPLEMEKANDAINRYSKAVDNPIGEAELRIFYVECGNNFTLNYGDIDGHFYDSLLDMFEYAIETVLETPKEEQGAFQERLKKIMESHGISLPYRLGIW
ncbi:MAG: hypothetical protein ABR512_05450 [Desulfopila sp.]